MGRIDWHDRPRTAAAAATATDEGTTNAEDDAGRTSGRRGRTEALRIGETAVPDRVNAEFLVKVVAAA